MKNLCPQCNFENTVSAKFCIECGCNIQGRNCEKCNAENDSQAKFCRECGINFQDQTDVKKSRLLKPSISRKEARAIIKCTKWTDNIIAKTPLMTLTYLYGIENYDGTSIEPGSSSIITIYRLGLIIHVTTGWTTLLFALPYDEIKEINFAIGEDIQESGSVIGGAVLGGILLGPLGAIIGGMSQAGSKTVKPSLLVIKHQSEDNTEGVLIFAIASGQKSNIHKFIVDYLPNLYRPS